MSKLSRAIKFIFAIWVTAFLLALPQAMQFSVLKQDVGYSCTVGFTTANPQFIEHIKH